MTLEESIISKVPSLVSDIGKRISGTSDWEFQLKQSIMQEILRERLLGGWSSGFSFSPEAFLQLSVK